MLKTSFKIALPLALLLVTTSVHASGAKTLEKVIKEISRQQKLTKTLEASFKQEKVLGLLAKPEISTGTFSYTAPNKVFWQYREPRPLFMLISSGTMTTYYPQLKKAEKVDVRKFQDRIFKYMGASGAIDELSRYFDFTFVESKSSPNYTLELKPKTKTVGKRVQRIKIWIDRQSFVTTKIEYVEGDGDLTRYEFSNIKRNGTIPDSRYTLTLPADVKVQQIALQ